MAQLFANNASSTLATSLAAGATSLVVAAGDGAKFPSPSGNDYMLITIDDGTNVEVVRATSRSTDTFAISNRGMEGTTDRSWTASTSVKVELRITAGALGRFGGSTPFEDELLLSGTANPAIAPTDSLYFYARKISGRMLPKWVGPAGVDYNVQESLYGNNVIVWKPTHSTGSVSGLGTNWTSFGTISHTALATASAAAGNSIVSGSKRTRFAAAATINTGAGLVAQGGGGGQVWRGTATGLGGFFYHVRMNEVSGSGAPHRLFIGLSNITSSLVQSTTEPSANNNVIGVGYDSTDAKTNLQIMRRDTVATTKTALWNAINPNTGSYLIDVYMYSPPNGSTIQVRVDRVNLDGSTMTMHDEAFSSSLPQKERFLVPQVVKGVGPGSAVAQTIEIHGVYLVSDY